MRFGTIILIGALLWIGASLASSLWRNLSFDYIFAVISGLSEYWKAALLVIVIWPSLVIFAFLADKIEEKIKGE